MHNLRQLMTFVGVFEERSFSKAAQRLNATQSGLSMQTQQLEQNIGSKLFERSAKGVIPTYAGQRFYEHAVEIIRRIDQMDSEIKALSGGVSGEMKAGLMPTFTRAVLAPSLLNFMNSYPNVSVSIVEAYSGVLTEGVLSGDYDFAIVPQAPRRDGIKTRLLGTDREILVRRPDPSMPNLSGARLAELPPLKLVLPNRTNARRTNFENYAELHGIRIATIVSMDAMIATLEFVAQSDFVTILPETICANDFDGKTRSLHPLLDPPLTVDYAVIQQSRTAIPPAATLFLAELEAQYALLKHRWVDAGWV
ncbi:LysR family transcriptional regulator [Ensifer adhaerens]|uniref:LysR family transcriptional regulator n=1 Tax=Ensifer adhaerens TaxID=106592 RepID=UPI001CBBB081|nr:LysR family transcriptional regulator [Ensifer adhaerens]MBZ7927725.1 LysR family transcriptional regulator [Ensifer adhaerens]UAX96631.1 LysR family transcriptional regulator [Ensifer adhaerens]UAY04025.1 LysR family transcriptional regulator [Ensifer adhaerens]UAY12011.1 LysR family transcriptional regulator [Ensifer adhaerens]